MLNVVIGKGRHSVVGVVVIRLVAHIQTADAGLIGSSDKVLGKKLSLLVEVVTGSL